MLFLGVNICVVIHSFCVLLLASKTRENRAYSKQSAYMYKRAIKVMHVSRSTFIAVLQGYDASHSIGTAADINFTKAKL